MTKEEIIKQHDKIIKEVNKHFTVIDKEIFDNYVELVMQYRIKEIPNWLFAVQPLEQLGGEGFWTFCEHNNLIDKFKKGRCYNDKALTYMSDYIQDIKDIVADEEKHYYISDGSMEDDYFRDNSGYDYNVGIEWDEETMRDKAHDLYVTDMKVFRGNK